MKTIGVILMSFLFCPLSRSQTQPEMKLPAGVRIYEPKNLTPERAQSVANSVRNLMNDFVELRWDPVVHAIVIRSQTGAADEDAAVALLKRFDVPEPKVDLTVSLIRAFLPSPAGRPPTSDVPPELKSSIDEMKGAFPYEHYNLWDTIVVPIKTNGEVQGILPTSNPDAAPTVYTVSYETSGPPTETKTVNFSHFQFAIKFSEIDSHIKTDLTIREGQKLVLGKIRLVHSNADLFLVLSTKVY